MHYALRPWPWILVALASLVIFPDLDSIKSAFPNIGDDKIGNDLAYSAMLTLLPSGLLGLVLASLISAYMSTISTQLNWGSSYIVYDYYKQQINPDASEKKIGCCWKNINYFTYGFECYISIIASKCTSAF